MNIQDFKFVQIILTSLKGFLDLPSRKQLLIFGQGVSQFESGVWMDGGRQFSRCQGWIVLGAGRAPALEGVPLGQLGLSLLQGHRQVVDPVTLGHLLALLDVAFSYKYYPGSLVDSEGVWSTRMVEK